MCHSLWLWNKFEVSIVSILCFLSALVSGALEIQFSFVHAANLLTVV